MDRDDELPSGWYYDYSNAFLVVCDAVYVHAMRENSRGVKDEIALAEKHEIPIFYSFEALLEAKQGKLF